MTHSTKLLFASAALGAVLAGPAMAQDAPAPSGRGDLLEEVVVTATRQADTVSRVPLSVTAVTQKSIDQSGVKSIQDLSRSVPSVTFRGTGSGDTSISIRGVISGLGAPTTGVYLDDTPIQRRLANGVNSGNGNAYPQLFDLERVEVLRGPQGTLYGGSSEGGTIRFITPAPSLTRYSTYARSEVSTTEGGGLSYEGGVAVGGPIVEDKLGFRVSIWGRHTGGYIDHVSLYDSSSIGKNTNTGNSRTIRLAATWAITDRLRVTPAYYSSVEHIADSDVFWEKVPQYTVRSGTFNNSGTIYGVPYSFPNRPFVGGVQGPFDQFGPFKTPVAYYPTTTTPVLQQSPRTIYLTIPSVTFDYDFDNMSVKFISSYINDYNKGYNSGQFGIRNAVLSTAITGNCGQGSAPLNYAAGCAPLYFPGFPQQFSEFHYKNENHQTVQELRFSSRPGDRKLSWVAGIYYSNSNYHVRSDQYNNEDATTIFLRGVPEAYFTGQRVLPVNDFAYREILIKESELAGFGEANYLVTKKLKVTAGVRYSRNDFRYTQYTGGAVFAPAFGFTGTAADPFPNATNGNNGIVRVSGQVVESPITPKFGLSYQATADNLIYATAAKGYRAGGVNVPANPIQCAAGIAAIGGTPPDTYSSDSVWSYEAGNKIKLFGDRAQVNSSAFYIEWKNPQISQAFPTCGYSYIANAGSAVSKGFDFQAQVRLFAGLSVSGSLAYTDARYTSTVRQPGGTSVVVTKGDELGAPKWQYNVAAQYDFDIFGRYRSYVRADYRYQGDYQRGGAIGTTSYDPISARGEATHFVTARAGVSLDKWDLSLFVNNLTNSQDRIFVGHGSGSPLITGATFRPREVGLQLTYRR
jgi:outer membrane receptor protein involved in Fe transport